MPAPRFWPFTDDGAEDPYPGYAAQRAVAPVAPSAARGVALVVAHGPARAVLRDPRYAAERLPAPGTLSPEDGALGMPLVRTLGAMAAFNDGERHDRLRRPLQQAFGPRLIARRRPAIAARCHAAVERLEPPVEVVGELAEPLVSAVLGDLVRLTAADVDCLRAAWAEAGSAFEAESGRLEPTAAQRLLELHAQLALLIKAARAEPADDSLGALVADRSCSDVELAANLIFVLNSGHRATASALALALHSLALHPRERERLRREPELLEGAVDELLRWDAPVQMTSRRLLAAADLDGCALAPGDVVAVLLGAANRDAAAFAGRESLDVGARAARHLSFGYGEHFCVGAALARTVLHETLAALLPRLERLELDSPPVWATRRRNSRGFERLRLRW